MSNTIENAKRRVYSLTNQALHGMSPERIAEMTPAKIKALIPAENLAEFEICEAYLELADAAAKLEKRLAANLAELAHLQSLRTDANRRKAKRLARKMAAGAA